MSETSTNGLTADQIASLESYKLPELKTIAKDLGMKSISLLRKNELIEAIREFARTHNADAAPDLFSSDQKGSDQYSDKDDHNDGSVSVSISKVRRTKVPGLTRMEAPRFHVKEKFLKTRDERIKESIAELKKDEMSKVAARQEEKLRNAAQPNPNKAFLAAQEDRRIQILPALKESPVEKLLTEIEGELGSNIVVEGTLEILPDGYGFLRSQNYNYAASPDDVYVSHSQVDKFRLRQGDCIIGVVRPPKKGERYYAMLRIAALNGLLIDDAMQRPFFEDMLPIYPDQRFKLEHNPAEITTRAIDLFSPLGKGQRGLIVAQPKTGKTTILRQIANAVAINNPETKIVMLLVDERPEEVTEMERTVHSAEVVASTFDERPENHVGLSEIVFEKCKRLMECGHDVLLLMDSITRLGRAYNIVMGNSGRTMTGGIDSGALKIPRQLFSSARNIENGGSLTIIATALVETGSRMDDVIFEEFKGTGNMEIVLDRRLSDRRIFPAIDVFRSGTRKEDLIVPTEEREKVILLRRHLAQMNSFEAMNFLKDKMRGTKNNMEFLVSMNQ